MFPETGLVLTTPYPGPLTVPIPESVQDVQNLQLWATLGSNLHNPGSTMDIVTASTPFSTSWQTNFLLSCLTFSAVAFAWGCSDAELSQTAFGGEQRGQRLMSVRKGCEEGAVPTPYFWVPPHPAVAIVDQSSAEQIRRNLLHAIVNTFNNLDIGLYTRRFAIDSVWSEQMIMRALANDVDALSLVDQAVYNTPEPLTFPSAALCDAIPIIFNALDDAREEITRRVAAKQLSTTPFDASQPLYTEASVYLSILRTILAIYANLEPAMKTWGNCP